MTLVSDTLVQDFFSLLFADAHQSEYATLWTLPSKLAYHLPANDLNAITDQARRLIRDETAVYYSLGLTPHQLDPKTRGKQADLCAIPGLWLDIDTKAPEGAHASQELPTFEQALEFLVETFEQPSILVDSGWGIHALWLFDGLLRFEPGHYHRARALVQSFQSYAIKKAAEKGWHLDDTSDLSRVLRLPGSTNNKIPTNPKPCELLAVNDVRYDVQELTNKYVRAQSAQVIEKTNSEGLTPQQIHERLKKLTNQENRALMRLVRKGEPFAKPGERDQILNKVCSILAFTAPMNTAEELASMLMPSLHEMAAQSNDANNPAPTLEDAVKKLNRALPQARAAHQRDLEAKAAVKAHIEKLTPPKVTGLYSAAELERFAREQGCSVEEFQKRWIIQNGNSYYVFVDGEYKSPILHQTLNVSLPRDLAKAPIIWTAPTKTGSEREKKVDELLKDYGTAARQAVADLALGKSYYDPASETFYEAVRPIRPIKPEYNERVDKWLRALGGPEAEKLLDWIATVTRLDKQSCALYISGPASTGKTMLAHGLARIWTHGGPTELSSALGNFNSSVTNCPLVFADEYIPKGYGSAELRQLIGTNNRQLKRKFMPDTELRGAVRLILAANNNRLLVLGDEDLSFEDLQAVAGRFLHIKTTHDAANYLADLGGRTGTDGWIDSDIIAAHALYLRDTREVVPGQRFLVEGHVTEMHHSLAVQGHVPSLVCEWLARYLDKPEKAIGDGAVVGHGRFLINTTAIIKHWHLYVADKTPPSTAKVGRALTNIAQGQERYQNIRYHSINPALVFAFAEEHQIGDPYAMRARVESNLVAISGAERPV